MILPDGINIIGILEIRKQIKTVLQYLFPKDQR